MTLAEKLLIEGFNATGTFRQSRKDVPKIIKEATFKNVVRQNSQRGNDPKDDIKRFQINKGVYAMK